MTLNTHRLHIENMTCGGCVRGVSRAAQSLDPAATIDATPETRRATIETTAQRSAVLAALRDAGYNATEIDE